MTLRDLELLARACRRKEAIVAFEWRVSVRRRLIRKGLLKKCNGGTAVIATPFGCAVAASLLKHLSEAAFRSSATHLAVDSTE
jgi:hypothetical protein